MYSLEVLSYKPLLLILVYWYSEERG